jgi:hypothetical protein
MNVDIGMEDAVVFVYTLGVMVTGLYVGTGGDPTLTPVTGVAGVVVALLWTAYFEWRVAPRVFQWERRGEDEQDNDDGDERPGVGGTVVDGDERPGVDGTVVDGDESPSVGGTAEDTDGDADEPDQGPAPWDP